VKGSVIPLTVLKKGMNRRSLFEGRVRPKNTQISYYYLMYLPNYSPYEEPLQEKLARRQTYQEAGPVKIS